MKALFRALATTVFAAVSLAGASTAALARNTANVYVMSNQKTGNAVLRYERQANGQLTRRESVGTGGAGTGASLGNQGGLVLSGRLLLATNAASNDVSVLSVDADGDHLQLRAKIPSGGVSPISIAVYQDLVYVLNAGDASHAGNITGFALIRDGRYGGLLAPLLSATLPLSAAAVGPAQIAFSITGDVLLVTEKGTNTISTYVVSRSTGRATGPIAQPSAGATPFGFAVDRRGNALVTEAFGGTASALSTYAVGRDGRLETLSASVDAPGQTAACWVSVTQSARLAFVSNTGTQSVSSYRIDYGEASLIKAVAATTSSATPVDNALSGDDDYFYVRLASGAIDAFRVDQRSGALTRVSSVRDLPTGANGLAAD